MLLVKFHCPGCNRTLRPTRPVRAGKAINCPVCGTAFVVAQPLPTAIPQPDYEPVSVPVPEEPRSGWMMPIIGLLLVAILAGVVFLGYENRHKLHWWGAQQNNPAAPPDTSPVVVAEKPALNFLPKESNFVLSMQLSTLAANDGVRDLEKTLPRHSVVETLRDYLPLRRLKLEPKDVDLVLVGGRMDVTRHGIDADTDLTVVIKTKEPYDRNKVLEAFEAESAKPEKFDGGREFFPLKLKRVGGPTFLHLPGDHLIVLSNIPKERRKDVLTLDGNQPALEPSLLAMTSRCFASPFWLVLSFHELRRKVPIEELDKEREYAELGRDLDRVEWVALRMDPQSERKLDLTFNLLCRDAKRAEELKTGLEKFYEMELKKNKPEHEHFRIPGAIKSAMDHLRGRIQFTTDKDMVVVLATLPTGSVDGMLDYFRDDLKQPEK